MILFYHSPTSIIDFIWYIIKESPWKEEKIELVFLENQYENQFRIFVSLLDSLNSIRMFSFTRQDNSYQEAGFLWKEKLPFCIYCNNK